MNSGNLYQIGIPNMRLLALTCFEIELTALRTCVEPQREVDKYAVAIADNENNIIGHLSNGKSGKYVKTIFYFLRSDTLNIC